ncbi:3972_t:CDS:2 [Funneliformis mosseae]|uniref:3972_t:CDS:1 n=1 Tax=Funneliformis mosseae TaxID=27381 RepID=A0A9N9G4E3_FUNMO|nr:3972_t:CDS:2 [Funneliformis mosseae]
MAKLSKWMKNNLNIGIRGSLDETIKALLLLGPPIKKTNVTSEQKINALQSSLKDILKNDKVLREEYKPLNSWLNGDEIKKINEKNLITENQFYYNFKKAIFFSSIIQQAISGLSDHKFKKKMQASRNVVDVQEIKKNETLNVEDPEKQEIGLKIEKRRDLELDQEKVSEKEKCHQPQIPQRFSFSESEQGAYVEPILGYVEKALSKYIKKHEKYIPSETIEKFMKTCYHRHLNYPSKIDLGGLLTFLTSNISLFKNGKSGQPLFHGRYRLNPSELFKSFKIEARDQNAHAITQKYGRWNDETLQRISTLSLEVVICLGVQDVQDEYKKLLEIRKQFDSELTKRLVSTAKEKSVLIDSKLDELTDFTLDIMNQLESSEKELKRIVQMAISKDELYLNVLRSINAKQDEDTRIEKFTKIMNILFEMKLKQKRMKADDNSKSNERKKVEVEVLNKSVE